MLRVPRQQHSTEGAIAQEILDLEALHATWCEGMVDLGIQDQGET